MRSELKHWHLVVVNIGILSIGGAQWFFARVRARLLRCLSCKLSHNYYASTARTVHEYWQTGVTLPSDLDSCSSPSLWFSGADFLFPHIAWTNIEILNTSVLDRMWKLVHGMRWFSIVMNLDSAQSANMRLRDIISKRASYPWITSNVSPLCMVFARVSLCGNGTYLFCRYSLHAVLGVGHPCVSVHPHRIPHLPSRCHHLRDPRWDHPENWCHHCHHHHRCRHCHHSHCCHCHCSHCHCRRCCHPRIHPPISCVNQIGR